MDSWEQLEQAAAKHARTALNSRYERDFLVFSGGWHLWTEPDPRYDEYDRVIGYEFYVIAAAVPPAEPTSEQRTAMEAAGWGYNPAGPGFERWAGAGPEPEEWLASLMVSALRDHLRVPLERPVAGPTDLWGSLLPESPATGS